MGIFGLISGHPEEVGDEPGEERRGKCRPDLPQPRWERLGSTHGWILAISDTRERHEGVENAGSALGVCAGHTRRPAGKDAISFLHYGPSRGPAVPYY